MTVEVDIVNRALQTIGTRTTVTAGQLAANSNNESIQANLVLTKYRDQLLRMAPWDCALKYANLIYLTSTPGTPENTSPATQNWQPGQPAPPWAYEYAYPDDCLRACFVIPSQQTGFAGVPITTAVTGNAPAFWQGMPIKFKITTDQFREAQGAVTIVAGGSGFQVNDLVILGTDTANMDFNSGLVPAGIVQIKVTGVSSGAITTATLQAFTNTNKTSYLFGVPTYTLKQVQTTGLGTGAQVTVAAVGQTQFDARILLTNQEFAMLAYVKQVTDPNVMDDMFVEAWTNALGAALCMSLTGDKALANERVAVTNQRIMEARKADGNEGLTTNDVTPDFIRVRGVAYSEYYTGPYGQFDWGASWPVY